MDIKRDLLALLSQGDQMDKIPLPELRDIHLPGEPSMWPLAIGWWITLVLLIVIFILVFLAFLKIQQHKKFKKYSDEVLQQFSTLEADLKENPSNQTIAKINTHLRQVAINTYQRESIAGLTGVDWLRFLDESGNTSHFTQGDGKILIEAPYQSESQTQSMLDLSNQNAFLSLIESWIKKQIKIKKNNKTKFFSVHDAKTTEKIMKGKS